MEKDEPSIIPTRFKSDLPRGTSYPCGAQVFTNALLDTPQISLLTIAFWQRVTPSELSKAGFRPVVKAAYCKNSPSLYDSLGDWMDTKWELLVHPVLAEHRRIVRDYLETEGFESIREWLHDSWPFHERYGKASFVIEFDGTRSEFRVVSEDKVQPRQ